jgi:hypothetical protein
MNLHGIEHAPPLIECGRSTIEPWNLYIILVTRACIHGYLHYSRRGRGRPANHPPSPEYLLTQHCKATSPPLLHTTTHNNIQQHYTTALGYIKLPMYQLFLWRLYIMVLRGATSLLGALEGVGPENQDFFGPKKVKIFRAHPFQCP